MHVQTLEIMPIKRITLASLKRSERLILTNEKGHLAYYFEYTPFTHHRLNTVWDLELLKSRLVQMKSHINWDTYQWVLNNFEELNQDHRSPADIIAQSLKAKFEAAADGIRRIAKAWEKFGYEVKK